MATFRQELMKLKEYKPLAANERVIVNTLTEMYLTLKQEQPRPPMMEKSTWNQLLKFLAYAEMFAVIEIIHGRKTRVNFRKVMKKATDFAYKYSLPKEKGMRNFP